MLLSSTTPPRALPRSTSRNARLVRSASRRAGRACAALAALAIAVAPAAHAAGGCTKDAIVIFDGSGSMTRSGLNGLDRPRIVEAREAVRAVVPRVASLRRLGLMIYGPSGQGGGNCSNIDLRFPPIADAAGPMISAIDALQPTGATPLTAAVARASALLSDEGRGGDIVLVTDGQETCGGAPCDLAARIAAEHPDVAVHVVSFKAIPDDAMPAHYNTAATIAQCLSERTGGLNIATDTVDQLANALRMTLGCPLYSHAAPASRPAPGG